MKHSHKLYTIICAALLLFIAACAGPAGDSSELFAPTSGAPVAGEPNTNVPGYWSGVVPWESAGAGIVEVGTSPQPELYPGDGKFTQAVSVIPFVEPGDGARASSSLAGSDGYYYAEYVTPSEVQGVTFDPSGGPAFACYELALPASAPTTIGIAWHSMPTNLDAYYIGIGDPQADVWHWYLGPDDGVLTFDPGEWGGLPPGRVLVCVALEDGKLADLWQLKAGVAEVRGTGLEPEELPDSRIASSVELGAQGDLPASVDLTQYIHSIRNQGSMGSCTAFACADSAFSIMTNQEYAADGWDTADNALKPSPMWAYVRSGIAPIGSWNPPCGGSVGRYMSQAFNVLEDVGCAVEETVPYYATENCSTSFPAEADTQASLLKITDWSVLSSYGGLADAVKLRLSMGQPVVIAMYGLENSFMYYSGGVYEFGGTVGLNGGHAMCIVGYDDSKGSAGAFQVRNSWGTYWGASGYWWISYGSVDEMGPLGRLSAYVMEMDYNPAAASHFLGVAPIEVDETEPNNDPTQADVLPPFPFDGYSGGLAGGSDGADSFSFACRAGFTTDFTVQHSEAQVQLQLELYTADGRFIYRAPAGESTLSGQWTADGSAVLMVKYLGGEGNYTISGSERQPPQQVSGLGASKGDRSDAVELSWQASSGASSYRIERAADVDGEYTQLTTTFGTGHTDFGAQPWQRYYYRVVALGSSGESLPSAAVEGYVSAPAPQNVQASDGAYEDRVVITWTPIDASGLEYTVKRSLTREGPFKPLATVAGAYYEDLDAEAGIGYFYAVSASRDGAEGPNSQPEAGSRGSVEESSAAAGDGSSGQAVGDYNGGATDDGRATVGKGGGKATPPSPTT